MSSQAKDLAALSARLESVNFKSVLGRGFALVRDADGALVRAGASLQTGQGIEIEFTDTRRKAVIDGDGQTTPPVQRPAKRRSPAPKHPPPKQGSLF